MKTTWKADRRAPGGALVWALTLEGSGVVGDARRDTITKMWRCVVTSPDGAILATWFSSRPKAEVAKEIASVYIVAAGVAFLSVDSCVRVGMTACTAPIGPKWQTPCGRCRPCMAKKEAERRYRRKFGGAQ